MNKSTGGPAFPALDARTTLSGMSLRDYFAAKAMQSILRAYQNVFDDETGRDDEPTFPELLAKDAYVMADAMLKARDEA
jgi:hypothetical protein